MTAHRLSTRSATGFAAAAALALVAGCSGADSSDSSASSDSAAPSSSDAAPSTEREAHEAAGPQSRLALTYDGGVLVLDGKTHEVIGDFPAEGFTRLNPAGDNRHVFLTEGDSFRLLDMGTWSEPHGDHSHSYTTDPVLSEQRIEGPHPGHVVPHDGMTSLFFDGSGEVHTLDPTKLSVDSPIESETFRADEAHHGVAIHRADGTMIITVGTEDERTGARIVDAQGKTIEETDECPGVHGEAAADDDVITLGCQDGILVIKGNTIAKVDAPDSYGRIGNQAGDEDSPVVFGDYKVEKDNEHETPLKASLTNTDTGKLTLVDLPASYTYRSLGRTDDGDAVLFNTDGVLRIIDENTGKITKEIEVMGSWSEPEEWQSPQPTLHVHEDKAYITEPDAKKLHIVDLEEGKVLETIDLPQVPNEMTSVSGEVVESNDHGDHAGHDHGDSDDDHGHGDDGHDHDSDDHDHHGHSH